MYPALEAISEVPPCIQTSQHRTRRPDILTHVLGETTEEETEEGDTHTHTVNINTHRYKQKRYFRGEVLGLRCFD